MLKTKDIDRICLRYIIQAVMLTIAMTIAVVAVSYLASIQSLAMPMAIAALFTLIVESVDAIVWRKVRLVSEDSLPTFFASVSGFRLLLAVMAVTIYYLALDKPDMSKFCIVFMAFYAVMIVHHSLFFAHLTNSRNRCDKENN